MGQDALLLLPERLGEGGPGDLLAGQGMSAPFHASSFERSDGPEGGPLARDGYVDLQ